MRDYILKSLDDLLSKNSIQFLKWDYNRNWSEPGWPEMDPQRQPEIYVTYIQNLYGIIAELRRRHPKLEIEDCAGDSPNWVNNRVTSLEYRFLSAMQGSLGIGANLNKWGEGEFTSAARMVAAYKRIRQTVQQGDLYRLIRPNDASGRASTFYVSPDKRQAVLFAFLHSSTKLDRQPAIQVAGLDPQKQYRVKPIDAGSDAGTGETQSGAYWMGHGVDASMTGDFLAKGLVFEAQ